MIPPAFKHRFDGDSGLDIGTESIDAEFPDGELRTVTLRLGQPFYRDNCFMIRAELENLDRTDGPLSGESSLGAILTGVSFIIRRLEIYSNVHGVSYFWPGTKSPYDIKMYGLFAPPSQCKP